jgi:porin
VNFIKLFLLAAVAMTCVPTVHAGDADPAYADDTLTGDWAGARNRWATAGVNVDLALKTDIFSNHGGLGSGGQAMWQFEVGVSADFEKLHGLSGLSGYLKILDNRGGRTNERHIGSFMGASNLEVSPAATRIFHAWLQHEAFDGRLSTLVGLYPIDSEFSVVETASMFSHPAYGPPADLSLTHRPSIFPVSAFGVRLRGQSSDGANYLQAALLDGVAGDPDHPKATHIRFKDGEGVFAIAELGRKPGSGDNDPASPGKLAVGVWGYSARAPDLVDVTAAGDPILRRRYGGYLLGETVLWRIGGEEERRINGFFRYSGTDGNSTAIRRALNIGVRIDGPLSGRPDDAIGIAFTRGYMGAKYRQAQALAGFDTAAREDALEIGYRAQIYPWLIVQPLVQHHRHPAADPSVRDSTLVGIRFEVVL